MKASIFPGIRNIFIINYYGELKCVEKGIFDTPRERKMAEFFPIFGHPIHDLGALNHLINKYQFNNFRNDTLDITAWTRHRLKIYEISYLDQLLMHYPFMLLKTIGIKAFLEVRNAIPEEWGIHIYSKPLFDI